MRFHQERREAAGEPPPETRVAVKADITVKPMISPPATITTPA
jgi:hypothetical protein